MSVSIDADLQDDVGVMAEMISKFNQGNDIIYGVRKNRPADGPFKKITALAFYRFLRAFGAEVVYNHADYRLTSRRVNEELKNFSESNLYLTGNIPPVRFQYRHGIIMTERNVWRVLRSIPSEKWCLLPWKA